MGTLPAAGYMGGMGIARRLLRPFCTTGAIAASGAAAHAGSLLLFVVLACASASAQPTQPASVPTTGTTAVLRLDDFKHHVDRFNTMEDEFVVNMIPNDQAWAWMARNVPAFECPDAAIEEIYWYRWWVYRKALKQMPGGQLSVTEFIKRNPISSAVGHQVMEGRWLREPRYGDDLLRYWLRGDDGTPKDKRTYSGWTVWAAYQRYLVNGDREFLVGMLPDFVAYYEAWERDRLNPDGSFWQFDVRDAMEESISGSRRDRNLRPTINSYMYGNAVALAEIAKLAGRPDLAETYERKAAGLKRFVQDRLWDPQAKFFKVRFVHEGRDTHDAFADVREAIGFIPWYFDLPDKGRGYEEAWAQLVDPQGFWAPMGLTTAERRHPRFRVGKTGGCEWNGPVWPFATAQTLTSLANVLNDREQPHVTKRDFLEAIRTYARGSHYPEGRPYIGEYHDEVTGRYLRRADFERGRYYNHSTFCDLIINGLVGIRPAADNTVVVNPLIPPDAWDYFCLDGVPYHGRTLTVIWDRDGSRYGRGPGLTLLVDGAEVARSRELTRVVGTLR